MTPLLLITLRDGLVSIAIVNIARGRERVKEVIVAEKGLFLLAAELERGSALAKSDPRRQIYTMGMTYREWALQHPQLYRLLFMDTPPVEGALSAAPSAAFAPVLAATGALVGASLAASATQAV